MYRNNVYVNGEYIRKNPGLHAEDSAWKVSKLIPLVREFAKVVNKNEINILDVGGGAGLIVRDIAAFLKIKYGVKVNKYLLDLSREMLAVQKRNNPDTIGLLNEDIKKTSLTDKAIDLTIMIDILEHIPGSIVALKEIKRITRFAIFKVPLEDNLTLKIINLVTQGKFKKEKTLSVLGHVNTYSEASLKREIRQSGGEIIDFHFTNVFEHLLKNPYYKEKNTVFHKTVFLLGLILNKISPSFAARIFNDFSVCLVKFL